MRRKKKYQRKKIPKFKRHYRYTLQDDETINKIKLLHYVYTEIAEEIFMPYHKICCGDWDVKVEGLTLFIDPVFGNQAEITGTSKLPLLKRVKIHIWLLWLLRNNYSILKAVKLCLSRLMTQY